MFVEKREYRLRTAAAAMFLEMVENRELPLFGEALDHVCGYFYSEIGDLNVVTVLWWWKSLEERERVRRELIGRFLETQLEEELRTHVVSQTNAIWKVAPFFDMERMRLRPVPQPSSS